MLEDKDLIVYRESDDGIRKQCLTWWNCSNVRITGLVPERQGEMAPQHNATARWRRRRWRSGRRRRRSWRNVFDQRWRPSDSVGVVVAARTTTTAPPSPSPSSTAASAATSAPRFCLPRRVDSAGQRGRNDPLVSRFQRGR